MDAPEFLDLFVEPTGELIYFLAVIAISQAALLMALGQRLRGSRETAAGRYTVLLTAVVLSWLAMGAGGLYALVTDTPDEAILPPLERAVDTLVIIFSSSALLAADSNQPERKTWRYTILLSLIVIAAYAYSAAIWEPLADDHAFNEHPLGFAWTFAPGLLLFGALALLFTRYRKTADIPLKLVFFLVLLAGYSYTAASISADKLDGHTSGALRLAFLSAMPILAIVIYRLVLDRLTAAIDEVSEYAEAISRPHLAVTPPEPPPQIRSAGPGFITASESMTLLKAIGLMLEKEDPDAIPHQITTAVATVLRADVAVLVSHEEERWADVMAAYDHIQQRPIPGLALNLDEQPTLLNAMERKTQRPLYPDRNTDELVDLYTRLDIAQLGPAYIQPLTRAGQVVGVLIVGLPYTNRELQDSEISLLEGLGPVAARLLTLSRAAQRVQASAEDRAIQSIVSGENVAGLDQESVVAARKEMQSSLELAQQQIAELSRLVRDLQVELDYERSRMAQLLEDGEDALSISQRIERLAEERQELVAERELLAKALQEAQTTLVSATAEDDEDIYSTMIEALRHERDELQVQKSKLERQLDDLRSARESAIPQSLREMLTELTEDKARLTAERDQIKTHLDDVQDQLRTLGFEGGPLAVAKALGQLTEERAYYKAAAEKTAQERELLLAERKKLEDNIRRESEREAQLVALEADIRRLATDREALIKQRDSIRTERDDLLKSRDAWLDQRTRLLAELTGLQAEMDDIVFELNQVNSEKKDWRAQYNSLEAERDRLAAERTALQTERDQLMARIEGNRELLEQLGADGVGTLKTMIDELTQERQELENQLLQTQQELTRLEREASRPSGSTTQQTRAIAPENADVVISIAQEFRTPMSSIMGYTDLLLSESVGILGALQRQFVQRVQANIDRLSTLVQDLISVTQLDSDEFKLEPETLDMLEVIEDAITGAGNQFKEKSITLHMSLADSLPPLRADRDAMHQVIMQLLSNAYLASPPNSEVTITAQQVTNFTPPVSQDIAPVGPPVDGIYITITDQGGGVPPDEQRRVFGRLYRADNPLIEGLGDTGVGLSIARALVEAHNGTIWLESELGQGSTFHFVIPLKAQHEFAEET
jgi:signal transduction histidine kinase